MNIPQTWKKHQGPGGAFEISLPPSWTSSEQTGSLVIAPGTGSGYLTIRSQPLSELQGTPDPETILAGFFPRKRDVKVVTVPDSPLWKWGRYGEAVLSLPQSWWKRWFVRGVWQPWTLWVAQSTETLFLALRKAQRDPEEESLIRKALETLTPLTSLPRSSAEFLQRILDFLQRHYPREQVAAGNHMTILFGKAVLDMNHAWKEFRRTPDRFEDIILARLQPSLLNAVSSKLPSDLAWETNRSRVMPMLLPEEEVNHWQPSLVCNDWIAGLKIAYVLDEPESYRYINQPLFLHWAISIDDLHEQALANLDGYLAQKPMEIAASQSVDTTQVLLPVKADAYNTARLLSRSFQKTLGEYLGREYAVGIPSRDLFVALRLDHSQLLSDVRQKIIQDFPAREFPLSSKMLLVSQDGVSELTEMDDHENR